MRFCVYGAASNTIDQMYKDAGFKLGQEMAKRGHSLVFGGGKAGMMGSTASGVYSEGGEVIGVAPSFFHVDGVLFDHCTELISTNTMRERKQKMEDLSDGFIVTPGGIGTIEEFTEMFSLKQLARTNKPLTILNINHYFDSFFDFIKHSIKENFIPEDNLELFLVSDSIDEILDYLENYERKDVEISKYRMINNED